MRVRVVAALLALAPATPGLAEDPFTIAIPGAGAPAGEVGYFDATGRRVGRLTGLGEPKDVAPAGGDRFLVLDRAGGRLLELDPDGHVTRDQRCPLSNPHPDRAVALGSGHVLLVSETIVTEINADGRVVDEFEAPRNARFLGAARLADGSTVFSSGEPGAILRRGPASKESERIPLGEAWAHARVAPRLDADGPSASTFLLWHHDLADIRRVTIEGGRLVLKDTCLLSLTGKVTADGTGGIVAIKDAFEIRTLVPNGTGIGFQVPFSPLGAVYLPGRALYAVSYVRVPSAAWPESWRAGALPTHFPVGRFTLFAILGATLGAGVLIARGRPPAAVLPAASPAPPPPATPAPALHVRPLATAFAFIPLALFAGALFLTHRGVLTLDADFRAGRDTPLLLGFCLAFAAALWDRIATRRKDSYWQDVLAAPAEDGRLLLALSGGAAALMAGLVVLYRWRAANAHETDSACLWAGLHILVVCMVAASFRGRVRLLATMAAHWPVLMPLAVACVTHLYRLLDVPVNTHFDFVYNSISALELLDGRLPTIFAAGFVPVPVVGSLPEMAGFLLAGPTETGFRLGPALAGISGVLAVYVLGTTWRGRAAGLLGAIFLAGAVPWIHFSRMSTTGVSAVAGLWLLVFFALALKTNRAGWWLLSGWTAGWCFYLWPASRVAPVACFLTGLVLALRSPRAAARRWSGPPLMAMALLIWLVPLAPAWIAMPGLALPRAQESLEVYKPQGGLDSGRLRASFGRPLARSAGWFFATPDQSSQGSVSPALNAAEATLFVAGVALAVAAGFSLNVLLGVHVGLVLLVLGAFAGSPPWYTRMLPSLPVACTFMGAAGATVIDFLRLPGSRVRAVALAFAVQSALILSPVPNLRRYVAYETRTRPVWDATALGRRLRTLGTDRTFYFVTTGHPDWSLDANGKRPPRLGEMLPYVWDLHLVELRELEPGMAIAPGPKAIVVPNDRIAVDLPKLFATWPKARIANLPGVPWEIVLID
jgi:hypothetical protein